MRESDTNSSKGYAFINFASFEASDAALEAMNGQFLCNRPITVSYAFKKDSKGERHGTEAERFLAAQNPLPLAERPHQLFADAPPTITGMGSQLPPPPAPNSMVPPVMASQSVAAAMFGMMGMGGPPAPPGMYAPGPFVPPPAPHHQFHQMTAPGMPFAPQLYPGIMPFAAMPFGMPPPPPPPGAASMQAPMPPPPPPRG